MFRDLLQLISVLVFCSPVVCFGQSTEAWNLDFEDWVDSSIVNTIYGLEDNFEVEGRKKGIINNWTPWVGSIIRTTDGASGDYGIVLNDWYFYSEAHLVLGNNPDNTWPFDCSACGHPIDFRPSIFTGNYKVIQLASDVDSLRGIVEIYLTKYDSTNQKRDTVGIAYKTLSETNMEYKSFALPINYTNQDVIPDTLILILSLKRYSDHVFGESPTGCDYCSYIYFDNLAVDQSSTSTKNNKQTETKSFSFYPNPCTTSLYIKNHLSQRNEIKLYNYLGQIVKQFDINSKDGLSLYLPDNNTGVYFLSDKINTYKLMIH